MPHCLGCARRPPHRALPPCRYDGCWLWSYKAGAAVGRRVVVDTARQGLDACVEAVVEALLLQQQAEEEKEAA